MKQKHKHKHFVAWHKERSEKMLLLQKAKRETGCKAPKQLK